MRSVLTLLLSGHYCKDTNSVGVLIEAGHILSLL